jgi:predicted MFS family arabinose efflux permease
MESTTDGQVAGARLGAGHGSGPDGIHRVETTHANRGEPRRHGWLDRALGLARNGDFAHLWAAQTVSQIGTQFSVVVLPLLAAVTLSASPLALGLLSAAAGLPHLLFGLLAGAWVDRLPRRPLMIAADLGRFALMATIPIAAWRGILTVELLIAIAFFVEALTVFFDIAYLAYLPSLVAGDQLVEANSRLEASASASQVIGPAFGGTLVRLLGAPNAMLIDAVSYLASAFMLARIKVQEVIAREETDNGILRQIAEGLVRLWRDPLLRPLALASGAVNFGGWVFLSIYVLYLTRTLGIDAGVVGLVFAMGGVGALAGSMLATPARRRWGTGPVLLGSMLLFGLFGLTVPLAVAFPRYALPLIVAAELLQWLALTIYNINAVSLRQEVTPQALLGRISGSMRFISIGMWPLGSLVGGYLGGKIGLPATLVVGALGMLLAFLPLVFSSIPRLREIGPQ